MLAVNPVAGKGRGKSIVYKAVEIFSQHGYRVTVLPTEPDRRTETVIFSEAHNYDRIVAIGGDGTLNNVASGIMKSGSDVALGYIPLGSTNDFAASLKLPKDVNIACEHIAELEPKPLDVGVFGDRYFVYIVCTGMFAEASYMTSQQLKNTLGHSAYLIKGLYSLKETKKMHYTVETESETIDGEFLFASVSNTLRAGGVVWLPKGEVEFDDGFFELTMIKAPKRISEGTSLVNDLVYSRLDSENFLRRKVKYARVRVDSPSGWSLDGENGGEHSEAVIEIKEKALHFIY